MRRLFHVTLNTGRWAMQTTNDVVGDALALLQPLVASGDGQLPKPLGAFHVEITQGTGSAVFTVSRAREPFATCGVAWTAAGAAEIWPEIESMYLRVSDSFTAPGIDALARQPRRLPWLAMVVLPGSLALRRREGRLLFDFARRMAAALIYYGATP
jgi:hypothetical protein